MEIRFLVDLDTGTPHIETHGVTPEEATGILKSPSEDRPGRDGSRIAIGRTEKGRTLRVIYVKDSDDSLFVITAYEVVGKPLRAYRRRRRKK